MRVTNESLSLSTHFYQRLKQKETIWSQTMFTVLIEAWRDQIGALQSSEDFNEGSIYFHCFFQISPRDGGITLHCIITLSCFTVRHSIRCDQYWSPPSPFLPHHPHHHLPPPMSPQNSLHLIIAKAVSDADDQPLQNSPIIISQPPPPDYLRGEKQRPPNLKGSEHCFIIFSAWRHQGHQVAQP